MDTHFYGKDDQMIAAHYGEEYEHYYNSIVPPVFMNSLNVFPTIDDYFDSDKTDKHIYCYGRLQNPTVRILEDKIAEMEHGVKCFAFASGMAAASAAVLTAISTGGHVICIHNAYGPLKDFLTHYCKEHMQVETTFIDGDDPAEFEAAMTDHTQLVILESPSSVIFSVQDITAVAEIAHKHNALVYIDNTYCTPLYQKPLDLGADVVMHTASKYLGGHSDLIGGVLTLKDPALAEKIADAREHIGSIIGPMEGWLILRGLRSISVRLKEHENTAKEVASWLEKHPRVRRVYYTGLESHPQYELIQKQQKGHTGLLSFELDCTLEEAKQFCNSLQIFKIGPSWGGFESLVMMPYVRQSREACKVMRGAQHIIRIHCGLEGAGNLIADLDQAMKKCFK